MPGKEPASAYITPCFGEEAAVRRNIWRYGLAVVLGVGLVGCERATVKHSYPSDPLLLSRRPVQGKPESSRPELASSEPPAPTLPPTALASAPKERVDALRTSVAVESDAQAAPAAVTPVVAQPVSNSGPRLEPVRQDDRSSAAPVPAPGPSPGAEGRTVNAVPAIRAKTPEVPALPAAQQKAAGPYGHAPDYSWVQGVLDKHYQGHWALRYCDHTVEDAWGGKVRLGKDARLEQFKEGDVVRVEGEILHDNRGNWHHYPAYQIHGIQLIERKSSGG
jgi:hypothetical protein